MVALHGGHVAQYLGDGLLVYFGWPRAYDDAAERAVRAGLWLADEAAEIETGGEPLAVRVGLHTGPVVVSALGGEGRGETLALGDTPNVAARVQGAAEPGSVLITEATQRLVPGMFVVEECGAKTLKGLSEPMVLYRVVQPSGVRSRLETSVGHLTPFVGRQTELGVLRDAWDHAVEGGGQAVLVQGEAGLGKSRLCYELRTQLTGEPHTWLECRCSPYTVGTAFHPVIELVSQALAFLPTDTPAAKIAKLAGGLGRAGFDRDETLPLLAEWLGLPEGAGYTALPMSADAKRQQTLETLVHWNLRLAQLQPLVVLVEDLHWCDPSSLTLLGRLQAQMATSHVLLVGTARPEFESPWTTRSNLRTLTLSRLTKRRARELVAAVGQARGLSEEVIDQLVERADGVPLFAEELTRSAAEADDAAHAIPTTLQDSLLARLDRLSSAKEVAQRASVLGREFSYGLLAAVVELDATALEDGLARLVDAELLFVRGEPPDSSYTFRHALVQEAAYESLLKRTRQQLHAKVADVLAADENAGPERLARHAELAGRSEAAVAAYHAAGEKARLGAAYDEAIRHLDQALALLGQQPEGTERDALEVPIQLALGGALSAARGYGDPRVGETYTRVLGLAEGLGDELQIGWACSGLASFHLASQVELGLQFAERELAIAERAGDADLALRGCLDVAVTETYRGRFASALAHLERALAHYDPERSYLLDSGFSINHPGVLRGYQMAWNLVFLGRPDQGAELAAETVATARGIGHPFSIAGALTMQTIVHAMRRDIPRVRERAEEAIAFSEANGFPFWQGIARTLQNTARVLAGEGEAAEDLVRGVRDSAGGGSLSGATAVLCLVADACLRAGELGEARGHVELGLALSARAGEHFVDAELHRLTAEIALAEGGEPSVAESSFVRGLEIARGQQAKGMELRAATGLARLRRDQGRRDEARELLAPVYGWFTEGFDTPDLKEAKALLAEL